VIAALGKSLDMRYLTDKSYRELQENPKPKVLATALECLCGMQTYRYVQLPVCIEDKLGGRGGTVP